jgi:AcrR family transcriptional regulator
VSASEAAHSQAADGASAPKGTLNLARWGEILAAAEDVFLERGYEATTVEEIASRVGLLKGSLYYYIRSKPDLLYHVLTRANVKELEELRADPGVTLGDAVSRLSHFVDRFMSQLNRERAWPRYFERDYFLAPDQLASLNALRHEVHVVLRDIIEQGMAEGVFDPSTDASVAANSILSMLTATTRWRRPSGRRSFDEIVAWYRQFIACGLAPAPTS